MVYTPGINIMEKVIRSAPKPKQSVSDEEVITQPPVVYGPPAPTSPSTGGGGSSGINVFANKTVVSDPVIKKITNVSPVLGSMFQKASADKYNVPKTSSAVNMMGGSPRGVRTVRSTVNTMGAGSFNGVDVPMGPYGRYDVVTSVSREYSGTPYGFFGMKIPSFKTQEYRFSYSPESIHKINIAGSVENYDKLLREIKSNPSVGAISGWTGQGLGNVDVAIYRLTGNETKAMETQISQVYRTRKLDIKEINPLSERSAWFSIVKAPSTTLAVSYGVGAVWGAGSKAAHGYLTSRTLFGASKILTAAEITAGSFMVGSSVIDIGQNVKKGDIGKAVGKTNLFMGSLAAGYKGYVSGASKVKDISIIGQKGEPVITGIKRENIFLGSKETGFKKIDMVTEVAGFKPLKTKELYIVFPENKMEMMSVGVGNKGNVGVLSTVKATTNEFRTWWGGRRIYTFNRSKVQQSGSYIGEPTINYAYFEKVYRNPNWNLEQIRINNIAQSSLFGQSRSVSVLKPGYESPLFTFNNVRVVPVFSPGVVFNKKFSGDIGSDIVFKSMFSRDWGLKPVFSFNRESNKTFVNSFDVTPDFNKKFVVRQDFIYDRKFDFARGTDMSFIYDGKKDFVNETIVDLNNRYVTKGSSNILYGSGLPSFGGLYGSGRTFKKYGRRGVYYKFREFYVPSLDKIFSGKSSKKSSKNKWLGGKKNYGL